MTILEQKEQRWKFLNELRRRGIQNSRSRSAKLRIIKKNSMGDYAN